MLPLEKLGKGETPRLGWRRDDPLMPIKVTIGMIRFGSSVEWGSSV
jgi:hypothetical protein